jgi:hypothetical protein
MNKKLLFALMFLLTFAFPSFSQAPQSFKYQAIARDATGTILPSASLNVRISIHDITAGGTIIYMETHVVTTNTFGLFNIDIGMGTPLVGTFSSINWGSGNKYVQQEVDFGTGYQNMGTSQLLSVPYALYAQNSGSGGVAGATGATGATGGMGSTGPAGVNGTNGTNGTNGATGVTGAVGATGATGTTGQDIYEVYGTAQLVVSTATTSYTLIPGLTQTITIPAGCVVYVETSGGIQSTGATSTTFSVVDVGIAVDGTVSTSGGQRRISIANTSALAQLIGNWSMGRKYTLSAGSHTFEVKAMNGAPGTSSANVSSAGAPQLQGVLTVMILKQ